MQRASRCTVIFLLSACLTVPSFAQTADPGARASFTHPEVVITANRLVLPAGQVASSVEVITAEDIERRQARTVLEALRGLPGMDVTLTGAPGQNSSVFLRGADSSHTLVLLNGIPLNDPISTGRLYEGLDQISTEDVERIEVVRGPQGPLYGSNAIGGVINILTKKGSEGLRGAFSAERGEYRTFRTTGTFSGAQGGTHFFLSASRFDTQGFSTLDASPASGDADGHENTTLSLNGGGILVEGVEGSLFLRYSDTRTELDLGGDDPDAYAAGRQAAVKGTLRAAPVEGTWDSTLGLAYSNHLRRFFDDPNDPGDLFGFSRSTFEGAVAQVDWQNDLKLAPEETLVVGFQGLREWGYEGSDYGFGPSGQDSTAETLSAYLESWTALDGRLFLSLGGRMDSFTSYGTRFTYRTGVSYLIPVADTKLKATYGTGFKTPSLYQLYSFYGDADLEPEQSAGFDLGIEQGFLEGKIRLGLTFFHNDFDQLIDFDLVDFVYFNVNKARTRGVETSLSAGPFQGFRGRVHYTYTDALNEATEVQLLRRPWHKGGVEAVYGNEKAEVAFSVVYVGERRDYPDVLMPEHFLVGLRASYRLDGNLRLYGRAENLFDLAYQEIDGFNSPGLSVFAGTEISL